ncbi:MAG: hypothetical protein GSR84_08275 [Desulfurococcales archaeon]|nr:hypothetical protein [Desulfurococcales archaeon]
MAHAADIGSTGSWAKLLLYRVAGDGDPLLVNLHVDIPEVDADKRGIAVYRYPTIYAPTPGRGMELVWTGKADPGDREKFISLVRNAPPVKYNGESLSTGASGVQGCSALVLHESFEIINNLDDLVENVYPNTLINFIYYFYP